MTYPQTNAELIHMLHEHDIKPTQQRMQIAGVLFAKPQHLSADQILDQVNMLHGAYVSKATVY
ncbi:MAG: transcriptional repressor, partial [Nitrospiraceae bacterium]